MSFAYWPGVGLVTCARCLTEYDETSDSVTWVYGDQEWRCTYEEECDNALFEQQQAGGHPDGF